MLPVVLTLTWLSSLGPIGLPRVSTVGYALRRLKPTWLAAGWVRGMIPPVNSPPVSIDPVPVAGHRALAAPLRHHGLKMRTGWPPIVEVEKLPVRWRALGQISCRFRVVVER